jgi:hypothetical protein
LSEPLAVGESSREGDEAAEGLRLWGAPLGDGMSDSRRPAPRESRLEDMDSRERCERAWPSETESRGFEGDDAVEFERAFEKTCLSDSMLSMAMFSSLPGSKSHAATIASGYFDFLPFYSEKWGDASKVSFIKRSAAEALHTAFLRFVREISGCRADHRRVVDSQQNNVSETLIVLTMPAETIGLPMPLPVAVLVFFITFVCGGGYIGLKIWFYRLNSRFRKASAAAREKLAGQAVLSEQTKRPVFVGFFHPYWSVIPIILANV